MINTKAPGFILRLLVFLWVVLSAVIAGFSFEDLVRTEPHGRDKEG